MNRTANSVFLSIAAVTITIGSADVLLAQNCGDLPPRSQVGGYRLAVKLSGTWEFFAPDPAESAPMISAAGVRRFCLAWEAPPYAGMRRQIVYVSTQYREDQPIWLWRSGAFQIPIISNLLGNWNRTLDSAGHAPDETFARFHHELPKNSGVTPWSALVAWHDTSAWFANQRSYDLVAAALGDSRDRLPYGTERLMVLKGRRPLSSWVRSTTYAPKPQDQLRVAVAFSGDLDTQGPRVYRYVLEVR